MKGYRSIDGNAVIKARIVLSDVLDVWAHSFLKADNIERVEFAPSLFYEVRSVTIKQGVRMYRYRVDVKDSDNNTFYSVLIDSKGFAKIDLYYPVQRDSLYLNLSYRKLFKYLHIRLLEERVARVDLALTIEKDISEVVSHVLEGKFYSVLNKKKFAIYGNPTSPNSVRFGDLRNVEVGIYDKSKEIFDNAFKVSYGLKLDDYQAHFGESSHVTRIEYRLGRNYLHNVGIETPEDVNSNLFDLFVTMQERYFKPCDRLPDGHHAFKCASWWDELPPLVTKVKDQQGRIMFNIDSLFTPSSWQNKYKMMMSRAEGYIASLVASMARTPGNIDACMQIIYRRLILNSSSVYLRAQSRFAGC